MKRTDIFRPPIVFVAFPTKTSVRKGAFPVRVRVRVRVRVCVCVRARVCVCFTRNNRDDPMHVGNRRPRSAYPIGWSMVFVNRFHNH